MLAVFAAGSVFDWRDFATDGEEESQLQPVLDSVFNSTFFVLFGAALPWSSFALIGWGKLVLASVLILALRRLPIVMLIFSHPRPPILNTVRERLYVGWFGPIGVGALFYATVASEELVDMTRASHLFLPLACFVVMCSVAVHGMTVPLFQLTMTRQLTLELVRTTTDFFWQETSQLVHPGGEGFRQ
jgi:NhaP-type Na+/H+ or K+/H+ antiporter